MKRKHSTISKRSSKKNWLSLVTIIGLGYLWAFPGEGLSGADKRREAAAHAQGGGGGGGSSSSDLGSSGGFAIDEASPRLSPRIANIQPLREYLGMDRGKTGVIADPYAKATRLPLFPPGTSLDVINRANQWFSEGRLTARQSEAVSQPYAPLYYSEGAKTYRVPSGGGSVNIDGWDYTPPPGTTDVQVTDFGSAEAAQAALDAYMKNFV